MTERSIIFKGEKLMKYWFKKSMGQRQTPYLIKKNTKSDTSNLNFNKNKLFLD